MQEWRNRQTRMFEGHMLNRREGSSPFSCTIDHIHNPYVYDFFINIPLESVIFETNIRT